MTIHNLPECCPKAVVSVSDMARMVGLSRARFYQLMGTAFPRPVVSDQMQRPHYTEEMQRVCLEVRRRNCGIDGKPILFYSARARASSLPAKKPRTSAREQAVCSRKHDDIAAAMKSLGLTVTEIVVDQAVKTVFPEGTEGAARGDVIRRVFRHLRSTSCRNSGGNVG